MIQKIGDYYVFEQAQNIDSKNKSVQLNNISPSQQKYQSVGNIKQRIQIIRSRFQLIKKQKLQNDKNLLLTQKTIFDKLKIQQIDNKNKIDIEIYIPDQILKLDLRISQIEQKLHPNQIFKRKMDQKGALVDRINILHQKLTQILQKSSQIIIANIQTYCNSLQDKQEHLKILFLKEALSKTQGLRQQILILQKYLNNLSQVQTKIKSTQNIKKTVSNHNQLLELNTKLSQRIKTIFQHMKSEYQKICKQIDQMNI